MIKKLIIVVCAIFAYFALEAVFGVEAVRRAEHIWIYLIFVLSLLQTGEKRQ